MCFQIDAMRFFGVRSQLPRPPAKSSVEIGFAASRLCSTTPHLLASTALAGLLTGIAWAGLLGLTLMLRTNLFEEYLCQSSWGDRCVFCCGIHFVQKAMRLQHCSQPLQMLVVNLNAPCERRANRGPSKHERTNYM